VSGFKRLWGQQRVRLAVLGALVLASFVLLARQLAQAAPSDLANFSGHDFTQYYGAARLLLQRANPYDPVTLLAMERTIGWTALDPILMWNPPWTLALVLPLTALPFNLAAWAWLALNSGLMLVCGAALWRIIAPGDRRYWIGMGAAIVFMPTLQALRLGQISPWLLVGITGFLVAVHARRDGLAGATLVLLTIKPHVSFLFLFAIAWWVVRERRWRVPLGAVATLAGACVVVGVISPAIFGQYLRAASGPPLYWRSATLGTWLRTAFGAEQKWLQFLPSVIGLILCVGWVIRRKGAWDWSHLAPGLLLASMIFATYGWGFDQVILLPMVVAFIVGLLTLHNGQRALLLGLYAFAQLGLLVQTQLNVDSSLWYWHPLVLAGLYMWQQRMAGSNPRQTINEVTVRE
jgi:hypothetical protein